MVEQFKLKIYRDVKIIYTRKQKNHCFFRLMYYVLPGTEQTTRLREKYPEIFIGIYNFNYLISNIKLNARLFTRSKYNNFGFLLHLY